MRFRQIAEELLKKPNCSMRLKGGALYIGDLHVYVRQDVLIINQTKNPIKSPRCIALKNNLFELLMSYDKATRSAPKARIKR